MKRKKESIEDILNLDYRKNENKKKINDILTTKIKYFQKFEGQKVPQIEVENFIGFVCRKFHVGIQYINCSYLDNELNMYCASIIKTDDRAWLGNVYGYCMLELINKTAIKLFHEIKEKKIPLRKQDREEGSED